MGTEAEEGATGARATVGGWVRHAPGFGVLFPVRPPPLPPPLRPHRLQTRPLTNLTAIFIRAQTPKPRQSRTAPTA